MIKTERLIIKELSTETDCSFILSLLNQQGFYQYIGDKNVRTLDDAASYIIDGPQKSFKQHGFGLMLVTTLDGVPVGLCGLLKRDNLGFPDLGYAICEQHYRKGYGYESCQGVLNHYQSLRPLLAITSLDNEASQNLLLKLGFDKGRIIEATDHQDASQLFQLQS